MSAEFVRQAPQARVSKPSSATEFETPQQLSFPWKHGGFLYVAGRPGVIFAR